MFQAEVDKLIDLVSSLKTERNMYSLHVQRLLHLLRANGIVVPDDMSSQASHNNNISSSSRHNSSLILCNSTTLNPQINQPPPQQGETDNQQENEENKEGEKESCPEEMSIRKPSTDMTVSGMTVSGVTVGGMTVGGGMTVLSSEQGYGSLTTGGMNSPRHLVTTLTAAKSSPRHLMSYTLAADSKLTPTLCGAGIKAAPLNISPFKSQPLHVSSKMLHQPQTLDSGRMNAAGGHVDGHVDNDSAHGGTIGEDSNTDFPRIINNTDAMIQPSILQNTDAIVENGGGRNLSRVHNGEILELAHIEGKSFSPNCYRKKVFLQQKVGENSEKANFVLFI